jgi:hypothetical protein
MRLEIGFDDDARDIRRGQASDRSVHNPLPTREGDALVQPGPLDRRVGQLREQAGQNRLPEIPRRQYERKLVDEIPIKRDREPVRSRHHLQPGVAGIRLHEQEKTLLGEAGRFRVVAVKDLQRTLYSGDERALRSDLRFLKEQGLISRDLVNARRDGRSHSIERIEVITLTPAGEKLARLSNSFSPDQKLYHGLVKPREAEHDSQIYRAYRQEWERIEKDGGSNPRVLLDFELKSEVQKAIYAARKEEPERDLDEIKQQVAAEQQLPMVDGQIQIPDARIEYDQEHGSHTGYSDIEIVTAAYHPGHLRAKARAGFHTYVSGRDAGTLTARIEGEHHLMDHILDL